MRKLVPEPAAEVDPLEEYRPTAPTWLRLGMVTSVDGSATDEQGRSGSLGGEPDLQIFQTLRTLADGILVGAGTVRREQYGPYRPSAPMRRQRAGGGKPVGAPLVVVTRSLQLDWSAALFTAAAWPTLVVTSAAAAAAAPPPPQVPLVVAGEVEVDLPAALQRLRTEHGLGQLLCEGGPMLATGLLASGLVDELCLTLAPTLLGSSDHTPLVGELGHRHDLTLTHLYEDRGVLLSRWRPSA